MLFFDVVEPVGIPFEEVCNLFKSSILRFWHFFVRENPEERKQDAEWQEYIVVQYRLYGEAHIIIVSCNYFFVTT